MKFNSSDIFKLVTDFVHEDVGRGDLTTEALAPNGVTARGKFVAEENLVLAGLEMADAVFGVLEASVEIEAFASDGDWVKKDDCFARVNGPSDVLLTGERVALNLMRHLSGIATLTRQYVDGIQGTPAMVIDTRTTTPGLRLLERYAVMTGGGQNYRMGLDDGVLIQNNHVALVGGIKEAIERLHEAGVDHLHKIEVEVSNRADLTEALSAGVDVVFFTKLAPAELGPLVQWAKAEHPNVVLGMSGAVPLDQARAYAETGIDLLAVDGLIVSARAAAISFKISTM